MENHFVLERKRNKNVMASMINNTKLSHKEAVIKMSMQTGITRKKVLQYLEELIEEGRIKPEAESLLD